MIYRFLSYINAFARESMQKLDYYILKQCHVYLLIEKASIEDFCCVAREKWRGMRVYYTMAKKRERQLNL